MAVCLVDTPARTPISWAPACSKVGVREVLMALLADEPHLAPTTPYSY
ncbi:hypothetical protein ACIBBE_32760 [Streptomyces sp. NPDC051644]